MGSNLFAVKVHFHKQLCIHFQKTILSGTLRFPFTKRSRRRTRQPFIICYLSFAFSIKTLILFQSVYNLVAHL